METVASSDIFFFVAILFITGGAVVFMICAIYIARIIRDISIVVGVLKASAEFLSEDVRKLREEVKTKGARFVAALKASSRAKKEEDL